jgi:tetratricopeptide (TPR) repeat protein
LNAEAAVYMARGEFEAAVSVLGRVLETSADDRINGLALHNLGAIAAQRGSWEDSRRHFMDSVKRFQRAGYHRGVAIAHNNYGRAALEHGNFKLAADLLAQAVASARRADDRDLVALATMNHAEAIAGLGDLERAESLASSALAHFTTTGNTWRRVECVRLMGDIARQRGNNTAAREAYNEALLRAREINAQVEISQLESRLAELA